MCRTTLENLLCPDCINGKTEQWQSSTRYASGHPIAVDCTRCGGTGRVTPEQAALIIEGSRRRDDRRRRKATLIEEARRLNLRIHDLAAMERGRMVFPDHFPNQQTNPEEAVRAL